MISPALWVAAALGVCFIAHVIGRRLERARLAVERDEAEREAWAIEAARREAADAEAREDARWAALLRAVYAKRSAGLSDTEAHHALTVHALRQRALGVRRGEWAA